MAVELGGISEFATAFRGIPDHRPTLRYAVSRVVIVPAEDRGVSQTLQATGELELKDPVLSLENPALDAQVES